MKVITRKNRVVIVLALLFTCLIVMATHATDSGYGIPEEIDPGARYLFFLHNYYVDIHGPIGDCKYFDILKAFENQGFTVISEIRRGNISPAAYAPNMVEPIERLLAAGVPPENIVVCGHSKGGVIALHAASLLQRPKIKYVVLAGCDIQPLAGAYPDFDQIKGNILSVYATSDDIAGSCKQDLTPTGDKRKLREIVLESRAGHRLFFAPQALWMDPVVRWIKGE